MIEKSIDDAKFWVSKAISYYKVQGREKSLAEFSNPKGLFTANEMYIFAMTLDGIVVAHGANKRHIGRDFTEITDSKGERYFQEVIEIANSEGNGVVEYWWINPSTQHIEPKNLYFEKVDDIIICSGIYE
ncbi:MAG TPA: cache domain-containing protein [Syntrophales bacterium]|jgi:signal transduction histidine kinase|nr:cache domain-containing protein [Syntrophales bacterium]HPX55986.1 cache domain-containing protein [Syntrophales bacterium]HQA82285.1 cache domain-containing protein [Syntrophales bacterium]